MRRPAIRFLRRLGATSTQRQLILRLRMRRQTSGDEHVGPNPERHPPTTFQPPSHSVRQVRPSAPPQEHQHQYQHQSYSSSRPSPATSYPPRVAAASSFGAVSPFHSQVASLASVLSEVQSVRLRLQELQGRVQNPTPPLARHVAEHIDACVQQHLETTIRRVVGDLMQHERGGTPAPTPVHQTAQATAAPPLSYHSSSPFPVSPTPSSASTFFAASSNMSGPPSSSHASSFSSGGLVAAPPAEVSLGDLYSAVGSLHGQLLQRINEQPHDAHARRPLEMEMKRLLRADAAGLNVVQRDQLRQFADSMEQLRDEALDRALAQSPPQQQQQQQQPQHHQQQQYQQHHHQQQQHYDPYHPPKSEPAPSAHYNTAPHQQPYSAPQVQSYQQHQPSQSQHFQSHTSSSPYTPAPILPPLPSFVPPASSSSELRPPSHFSAQAPSVKQEPAASGSHYHHYQSASPYSASVKSESSSSVGGGGNIPLSHPLAILEQCGFRPFDFTYRTSAVNHIKSLLRDRLKVDAASLASDVWRFESRYSPQGTQEWRACVAFQDIIGPWTEWHLIKTQATEESAVMALRYLQRHRSYKSLFIRPLPARNDPNPISSVRNALRDRSAWRLQRTLDERTATENGMFQCWLRWGPDEIGFGAGTDKVFAKTNASLDCLARLNDAVDFLQQQPYDELKRFSWLELPE